MAEPPGAAEDAHPFRSGIVAIVGRPNVGKSTLLNALVGQKIAIVSDKPQTTRRDIRAISTDDDAQIVYTDTPGFHKPRTLLGARLNDLVGDAVAGVDVVVQVVDGAAGVGRGDAYVYEQKVAPAGAPAICVVNKLDAVRGHAEVPQLARAAELGAFDEVVPVSAATGAGVATLRALLVARLPEGPPLYPPDDVTDQSLETRLAELIREQALHRTRDEVPHSIAVEIDEMERGDSLTRIHASLVVERDSQKGIVIGKGGATLKAIGTDARAEMERLLGTRVYLDLRVTVLKEWQRDPRALERLGF
jgi:GTP-binding protein Era